MVKLGKKENPEKKKKKTKNKNPDLPTTIDPLPEPRDIKHSPPNPLTLFLSKALTFSEPTGLVKQRVIVVGFYDAL